MGRERIGLRALAAVASFALASCGHAGTSGRDAPALNRADEMVIEVSVGGGLVRPAVRVSDSLPRIWIAADGRYLRQSPDGSDNTALTSLDERRIPDTAIAGLLDEARAAGLLEDNPDYGSPPIADAMVTRVVTVADGKRHSVLVSALGYPNLDLSAEAVAARTRLSEFLDSLEHPERITGVSGPSVYKPAALAVFVLGVSETSVQTPPATWPLGDLGTAGAPMDWPDRSVRCLAVTGDDAATVVSAAAGVSRSAPWRSGNRLWDIALRPLLPDEHTCADVVG